MNESKREQNRREAPNVADVVDQFNKFFGPVKVIAAEDFETGKQYGKFDTEADNAGLQPRPVAPVQE